MSVDVNEGAAAGGERHLTDMPSRADDADPSRSGRLRGKVAVVSGATSGIGASIATRLHSEGARVLITGRSAERGKKLAGELGEGAEYFVADLAEEDAATKIVRNVLDTFGAIHVLVNNAALDHTGSLLETPMADVRALFEINTFGAIRLTQAAGLAMWDHGGSIVNITSRLASIAVPTMSMYSASKGALLSFTRAAAVDLAPYNIRVNAVAPGMTRTPLYDEWIARQEDPADVEEATVGAIPLGRLAVPDDVAAAVAYLCSPDAAYITGTTIAVDGGYTAR